MAILCNGAKEVGIWSAADNRFLLNGGVIEGAQSWRRSIRAHGIENSNGTHVFAGVRPIASTPKWEFMIGQYSNLPQLGMSRLTPLESSAGIATQQWDDGEQVVVYSIQPHQAFGVRILQKRREVVPSGLNTQAQVYDQLSSDLKVTPTANGSRLLVQMFVNLQTWGRQGSNHARGLIQMHANVDGSQTPVGDAPYVGLFNVENPSTGAGNYSYGPHVLSAELSQEQTNLEDEWELQLKGRLIHPNNQMLVFGVTVIYEELI